ncbi:MAG: hypothetical protein ACQGVK_00920 [Myxococcota bacterium]
MRPDGRARWVSRVRRSSGLALVTLALAGMAAAAGSGPLVLITPEEAELPNLSPVASVEDLTDGPEIRIVSPEPDSTQPTTFPVEIEFHEGPSGAPPNLLSLKVTYKKAWGIDITSRLSGYVEENRISVPDVIFPSGKHTVLIYIEDEMEKASTRHLTVRVEKD